mmetsp:Transcript_7381/g.19084  ORF Transcript_7381/g.19084 Transcript_7381/m.19084 type:complete len:252 (-) Transcript_7381:94-849(-)
MLHNVRRCVRSLHRSSCSFHPIRNHLPVPAHRASVLRNGSLEHLRAPHVHVRKHPTAQLVLRGLVEHRHVLLRKSKVRCARGTASFECRCHLLQVELHLRRTHLADTLVAAPSFDHAATHVLAGTRPQHIRVARSHRRNRKIGGETARLGAHLVDPRTVACANVVGVVLARRDRLHQRGDGPQKLRRGTEHTLDKIVRAVESSRVPLANLLVVVRWERVLELVFHASHLRRQVLQALACRTAFAECKQVPR